MAGLQHTREGAGGSPAQEPREGPSAADLSGRSQPLGVVLFCKRKQQVGPPAKGGTGQEAQEALKTMADLERQVQSRVYRVYACDDNAGGRWEYFTVLEFSDLQAWNGFERRLERTGFGTHFDYEVRAFGRRLGGTSCEGLTRRAGK